MSRESFQEGVFFTSIADTKFKNNHLSVNFLLPLRRETAAVNALLPMVLRRGCREYPDMTALNRRLKELYGAHLDGGVTKRGEIQIVTLHVEVLGDEYALAGEALMRSCAALLRSVLFDPAFENGCFRAQDVEIEKRNLADLIDSQLNDKRYYASQRLKEEMCENEPYGVFEYGRRDDALAVTPQALFAAWKSMLQIARAEIFLVGSADPAPCRELFREAFSRVVRGAPVACDTQVIRDVTDVKTVTEHLPVSQAKLGLGFRAGTATPDTDVAAMQLACTVLGGSPQSKLFMNVREKMSLCYYCFSRFERQKGLVFIESGIEQGDFERAKAAILQQLDDLKAGDFTQDDLKFAALSLVNSYRELNDSLGSIAGWYLGQAVTGTVRTPSQAAEEVLTITREDIIRAAAGIRLDTVYLLTGEGGTEHAV